jgi:hypothetical protein
MRVVNAPTIWLDWRPACVVGGWIVALYVRGVTRPDGTRSVGLNVT